ncbi:MAG: hypothetical protein JSV44_04185, partial [Candidatus Zixiibacteriota bacterium]
YTALTLKAIGTNDYDEKIQKLLGDRNRITSYNFDTGRLHETTVGNLIAEMITDPEKKGLG